MSFARQTKLPTVIALPLVKVVAPPDGFNPILDTIDPDHKICTACTLEKPIEYFYRVGGKLRGRCKCCYNNGKK